MITVNESAKKLHIATPVSGTAVLEAAINRVIELELENQQLREDKEALFSSGVGLVQAMEEATDKADEEISRHMPKTKQDLEDAAFESLDNQLNRNKG